MGKIKMEAKIIRQDEIATDIYSMVIQAPEIASQAVPGQFIDLILERLPDDRLVLRKRTGDNLPRHNVHKRRQCLHLLMVDIADIHVFPPIMFVGS